MFRTITFEVRFFEAEGMLVIFCVVQTTRRKIWESVQAQQQLQRILHYVCQEVLPVEHKELML